MVIIFTVFFSDSNTNNSKLHYTYPQRFRALNAKRNGRHQNSVVDNEEAVTANASSVFPSRLEPELEKTNE